MPADDPNSAQVENTKITHLYSETEFILRIATPTKKVLEKSSIMRKGAKHLV